MPLYLKYISYEHCIVRAYFFIHSDHLCLLIEVFSPFIFDIIINMIEFRSTILIIVFYLFSVFFAFFSPILLSSFGFIEFFKKKDSILSLTHWLIALLFCSFLIIA